MWPGPATVQAFAVVTPFSTHRLLLHPDVGRAAIDRAAALHDWRLVNVSTRRRGQLRELFFTTSDGSSLLTFVEDHLDALRYLVVQGYAPELVVERARVTLATLDVDAVMDRMGSEPARALRMLAFAAPSTAAEPALSALLDALSDPDPDVREAAQFARATLGWPELGLHEPIAPDAIPLAGGYLAPPPLPARPRIPRTVQARRQVTDGTVTMVLTDTRNGRSEDIDPLSWHVLTWADGTRDLDGLALASAQANTALSDRDLRARLTRLNDAGMLADGVEQPNLARPITTPPTPLERPLEPLEGFRLVCDGSGSCCRLYGSVVFEPLEAMRARLTATQLRLPLAPDEAFTPAYGAQLTDASPRAVALVDGACVFYERGGRRCGLHARGGPEAKPFPCRFYPGQLMDDGIAVRVSLGPECACVFASARQTEGDPLVPVGAQTLGDLGPSVRVMTLPEPVPLTRTSTAPRRVLREWSAYLGARLTDLDVDAVEVATALARTVERDGLSLEALEATLRDPPCDRPSLSEELDALRARARKEFEAPPNRRTGSPLSCAVARWLVEALEEGRPRRLLPVTPEWADDERFYLRALAHGHRLALEGRPLAHGLRDRATRLLAARAMRSVPGPPETRGAHALAMLEAAMRHLGLANYHA